MVSHSNDGEFDTDPRLVKIPAADYAEGSERPVYFSPESYPRYVGTERGIIPEYYPQKEGEEQQKEFQPIGYIPQVPHTFAYLEDTYGAVNERQVGIGENTCSGVFSAIPLGAPNGTALFSIDALTQIAMERSSTAREAITIMGSLAEEYGFYGAGEFEGTAEALAVNDPDEVWIFHILPDPTGKSAIWAAQKLPDDAFSVMANMFVIRHVDPTDTNNFLMSESVHSVAIEYGWWHPTPEGHNEEADNRTSSNLLDFTAIYSDGEYAHKYYSGRRMWGAYLLACPSCAYSDEYVDLQSDPVYPVYTRPDYQLAPTDLFRFHRFAYEGTKYDMSAEGNLAGGPFSSPDRWKEGEGERQVKGNWERSIGLFRTSDTYVVQSFPVEEKESTGAVLWFGPASSLGTVFVPFVVALSDIPTSFRSGHHAVFSRKSAFWASAAVHNIANLKWSYAVKDIQQFQTTMEKNSLAMVKQLQEQYSVDQNFDSVESAYLNNAEKIVTGLWELSDQLLFKYASGFVNEPNGDGMSQMVGYPAWWLEAVGYRDGPPPPPTQPKCCHPPKAPDSHAAANAELTGKVAMKHFLRRQKANSFEEAVL